jgi:hypothetical protein
LYERVLTVSAPVHFVFDPESTSDRAVVIYVSIRSAGDLFARLWRDSWASTHNFDVKLGISNGNIEEESGRIYD